MAYVPELDARPTVVRPELVGTLYDAALDGEPLLLAKAQEVTSSSSGR